MARILQGEINWPSDEEFEQLTFSTYANGSFEEIVCVADGTEIEISRPSDPVIQRQTWSAKKKQNSLNVMIITKLNGEIIYFSPLRVGAHDQSHWNELHLRNWFLGKKYGIMADGGFAFNRKKDDVEIIAATPHKKKRGQGLTASEKEYNLKLSETRVVVENAIRRLKQWKILKEKYHHWRNGEGQIDGNNVLTICTTLANRWIRESPPRKSDWLASDWVELMDVPAPTPPLLLDE